jgi:anaerobic selenocysteine-containing dehydrogenase
MSEQPAEKPIRSRLSRRDLLKALPAAGAVAAGAALTATATPGTRKVAGTCRLCLNRCGIRAVVGGDRLLRVEGSPGSSTRGFICMHGMAIRELVHSRSRVRRPLKRVGGSFQEVSWERALNEIAERLVAVKDEFGPQALAVQTGWALVAHPIQGFLMRFCQAFGTPNLGTVESLCQSAARIGETLTAGSRLRADVNRARTIVLWGANPVVSHPAWARAIAAVTPTGRNLVVIDPLRTEFAAKATLHLQLRPGTDGALALGLMHVIVHEGLHNRRYIEQSTSGFDRLLERIERYDPARVATITSLSVEQIRRAARIIAGEGPTSIWTGLGIEHHEDAGQTVRAVTILAAVCGDIDVPGGYLMRTGGRARRAGQPLPSIYRMATPRPVPPPVRVPPIGHDAYPLFEMFNRQAQANLFARAILEDRPYPLRALILFGSNALVTAPGSERMRQAARKLSLLVSVDPFLTDSGKLADYVLPAATFAEGAPPQEGTTTISSPLVAERGESRSDWSILTGLAAALGLERYFPWATLEEAMAAPHERYMRAGRTLVAASVTGDNMPSPRFPTVSGKIEIYSKPLARFGYDPLPDWKVPAAYRRRDSRAFPLLLVTGPRTRVFINSQFRQIPSVRGKMPRALVELHPDTARSAGIRDGDRVAVVSPHGRIVLHAELTDRVRPDCAVVPAGWGDANANLLTDDARLDPLTGFPALRSGVCRVEPFQHA